MTPEQLAMRAKAEIAFIEKFERLDDPDANENGKAAVEWLLRNGWRPRPALAARAPEPGRAAPPEVARAHLAQARTAIAAKRGHRPEAPKETES